MKIGDLVELSSYGKARQQNAGYEYGYGLIIAIDNPWLKYPLGCVWYNHNGNGTEVKGRFHPRELKKYKRT